MTEVPETILSWFAVKDHAGDTADRIHRLMGLSDEPVTLASQQSRAHNLAWALNAVDPLRCHRVAVVGGGLAGLTFAVIAGRLGAKVTLYEQAGRLLFTQWKSYDRYLHPRLFHWPEDGWADGRADHPALTWRDNFAAAVRDVVLAQVPEDMDLDIRLGALVTRVHPGADGVTIHVREVEGDALQVDERHFGRAILATGFPAERPVGKAFGGSYWRAHCEAALIPDGHSVRIVGNGDGALTDLMSLSLPGFRQDRLRNFARALENQPKPEVPASSTGSIHGCLTACLKESGELGSTLGRVVDDLSVELVSTDHKLTEKSFLLNRCAAVAIEQAQMQRDRPPIFCTPRDTPYSALEVAQDVAAGRQVVWRVGPGGSNHLLLTFNLSARWICSKPDSWRHRWCATFAQLVTTTRQGRRRDGCHDVELPDRLGEPLRSDGVPTPLLTEDTEPDRVDVEPALDALTAIVKRHVDLEHILDTSAVRLVGDEATDDRQILLALDAVAAVASLPTALVVDSLLEKRIAVYAFGSRLILVARGLAETSRERDAKFQTLAAHVAIDAAKVRAHLLRDRRNIYAFLENLDLIEAVALAIRSRRRQTDLPAAVLIRIAERPEPPEGTLEATSRLLRLVAIAVTPGSAGGQGRLGLLNLGRAALRNRWIANDLAEFIGTKPDRLGQRLVFSSLLSIAAPLHADTVLPMTLNFVRIWARTVAPRGVNWLPRDEVEPYRQFVNAVRKLVDPGQDRSVEVTPAVEAMMSEYDLEARLAEDADAESLLRRFGLTVVSPDGV